ncbi:hypothetical protein [Tumebacillus permanentifrigoris]|uniref:Uncharacterized protein n=1 Tax=Tumebacillus permanentifrigoris TaxID=378543 RepID=A0A316D9N8_9BACL|nr:hypothetical protein [Tumebacillus permanentifrigoris]PWK13911.1 hypothetical protein C7459_106191 [Tumebacillus permanentifrigoris]
MNQQYGNQYGNTQNSQFNQGGFQQGVSQQQLDRIHQNSLFNGQETSYNNAQVQRIHAQSMQNGTMANPQVNNYAQQQQGFGGGQTFSNQAFSNQGMSNQQFQQGVSQQQIDRIHQASLFNGQETQYSTPQVQRIHAASMQNGTMANPQVNSYAQQQQGFGGGQTFSNQAYMNQGNTNQGYTQGLSNQQYQQGVTQQQLDRIQQATMQGGTLAQPQLSNFGGQTFTNQGFNTQGMSNQQFQQGVSQQQLDRIHQASLYNGQETQYSSPQVQRIHAQSMQNGTMANPQVNSYAQQQQGTGFGQGLSAQSFGGTAFNQVMSADAGIRDAEGRTDVYPQALYTGRNQYDTVNTNVLNQMVGRQF